MDHKVKTFKRDPSLETLGVSRTLAMSGTSGTSGWEKDPGKDFTYYITDYEKCRSLDDYIKLKALRDICLYNSGPNLSAGGIYVDKKHPIEKIVKKFVKIGVLTEVIREINE